MESTDNDSDCFDQLTPDATAQFDLRQIADLVEVVCNDQLAEPPKGIYYLGQAYPAMVEGKSYYTHGKDNNRKLIEDINEVTTAVYNVDGKCVIPARYMRDKVKCLANTPMLPYRGLMITKAVVDNMITKFAAYHRYAGKSFEQMITPHFEPNVVIDEVLVGNLEKCCKVIRRDIDLFLAEDRWRMFFVTLNGTTLRIERCMDWRAWEWERKHGDEFRAGRYR